MRKASLLFLFLLSSGIARADTPSPDAPLPPGATGSTSEISASTSTISVHTSSIREHSSSLSASDSLLQQGDGGINDPAGDLNSKGAELNDPEGNLISAESGLATNAVKVTETEKEITIEISSDVLFDFDRWGIRPDAAQALHKVAGILKQHDGLKVSLSGHTDSVGTHQYNAVLSEKRARSVLAWLIHKGSLSARGMNTIGHGESQPVARDTHPDGSDNPRGRQLNRRVEIRIEK